MKFVTFIDAMLSLVVTQDVLPEAEGAQHAAQSSGLFGIGLGALTMVIGGCCCVGAGPLWIRCSIPSNSGALAGNGRLQEGQRSRFLMCTNVHIRGGQHGTRMNAMIADMPSQSSRVDPERQQHIIDAALRVIASRGVAGTSHRVVAAEAHVPLGSMTYYFDGMHDLLHQAFDQFARASVLKFAARMQSASTVDEACDAIALSIERDMLGNQRDLNINLEFYTLAARDLSFRDISDRWMSATQKVMGRFFDSETTVLLDAMIEGLTLHRALGGEPRNPQSIRDGIRRIIDHRR